MVSFLNFCRSVVVSVKKHCLSVSCHKSAFSGVSVDTCMFLHCGVPADVGKKKICANVRLLRVYANEKLLEKHFLQI